MRGKIKINYHTEPCKVRVAKEWKSAEFLGVFQSAGTDLFGHPFGKAIAAVKIDGWLGSVELADVIFDESAQNPFVKQPTRRGLDSRRKTVKKDSRRN